MNWQGLQAFNDLCDETQGIGHIYFIRCQNAVKIGYSYNVINRFMQIQGTRSDTLRPAFFSHSKYTLLHIFKGSKSLEHILHKKMFNKNLLGEWYVYDKFMDNLIDFMIDIEEDRSIWDNGWMIEKKRPQWWDTLQKIKPLTYEAYISAALRHFDAGSTLVLAAQNLGLLND